MKTYKPDEIIPVDKAVRVLCRWDAMAIALATLAARDARVAQLADVRAVLEGVAVENLPLEVSK